MGQQLRPSGTAHTGQVETDRHSTLREGFRGSSCETQEKQERERKKSGSGPDGEIHSAPSTQVRSELRSESDAFRVWNSNATKQIGVPWIRANTVPARIETEPHQPVSAIVESFLEPAKSLVVVAHSGIDERDSIGSHIFAFRHRVEFGKGQTGVGVFFSQTLQVSDSRDGNHPIW